MTSTTVTTDEICEFVKYVDSFYGVVDPLYPMMSKETGQPLNTVDIYCATKNYLDRCVDFFKNGITWGGGDSLDRERVRDILLDEYNYKFVGE